MTLSVGGFPKTPIVNFNGQLMPKNETPIDTYHPVVFYADSVYDAVFAPSGRPFNLDHHLDRLFASAKEGAIEGGPTRDQWKEMIHSMLVAFGQQVGGEKDVIVYMQMAMAPPPDELVGQVNERDMVRPPGWPVDAWAQPLNAQWLLPKPELLANGMRLATVEEKRHDYTHIKATSLFATKMMKREALANGGDDALIVGRDGNVKENTASNTHMVLQGTDGRPVVVTPAKGGLLEGIRIPIIAGLCEEAGIAYERRDVPIAEARQASELLVTSATRGIVPATTLDGEAVGTGRPGPVFATLRAGYDRLMDRVVQTQPYGVAGVVH